MHRFVARGCNKSSRRLAGKRCFRGTFYVKGATRLPHKMHSLYNNTTNVRQLSQQPSRGVAPPDSNSVSSAGRSRPSFSSGGCNAPPGLLLNIFIRCKTGYEHRNNHKLAEQRNHHHNWRKKVGRRKTIHSSSILLATFASTAAASIEGFFWSCLVLPCRECITIKTLEKRY